MNLTVRIEEDLLLVSNDDGDTWRPTGTKAAELRAVVRGAMNHSCRSTFRGAETAVLRGSLAEAECVRPIDNVASGMPREKVERGIGAVSLGAAVEAGSGGLHEILDRRRSERSFEPPGFEELATLLVRAGRVRDWQDLPDGGERETRAMPSAGGCHPVELYVLTAGIDGLSRGLWRFEPVRCELHLEVVDEALIDRVHKSFADRGFMLRGGCTAVFVVADFARTLWRYPSGSTLVWRDVGVALGFLHLCASDSGLASCVVGCCGLLGGHGNGHPDVGAVLIGRSVSD